MQSIWHGSLFVTYAVQHLLTVKIIDLFRSKPPKCKAVLKSKVSPMASQWSTLITRYSKKNKAAQTDMEHKSQVKPEVTFSRVYAKKPDSNQHQYYR